MKNDKVKALSLKKLQVAREEAENNGDRILAAALSYVILANIGCRPGNDGGLMLQGAEALERALKLEAYKL